MPKLYVFAMGGTGSRVLKAFTMLLSAGARLGSNIDEVVPIIIDPDLANGNKNETVNLLDNYRTVYDSLSNDTDRVKKLPPFSVKIKPLNGATNYAMKIGGDNTNSQFRNYMAFSTLSSDDKALVGMLFSQADQEVDMTIGFTGKPNIGSVILNQFDYTDFAGNFNNGDKIFIISSIFGGTGASMFPLLLKNLRAAQNPSLNIANGAAIASSQIGAITVLPYFNLLPDDDSPIDSNTFISKTKSALSYYEHNLTGLDVLYYIGDPNRSALVNNAGGKNQRNPANFCELAAALAIFNFASDPALPVGGTGSTIYREYGINGDCSNGIVFPAFSADRRSYTLLTRPLTNMALLSKYLKDELETSIETQQTWIERNDYSFSSNNVYRALSDISALFMRWMTEMDGENQATRFSPIVLTNDRDHVFELARGLKTKSVLSLKKNWDLFLSYLNDNKASTDANKIAKNDLGKPIAHILNALWRVSNDKIAFNDK